MYRREKMFVRYASDNRVSKSPQSGDDVILKHMKAPKM